MQTGTDADADVAWEVCWETELGDERHAALRRFLTRCYPAHTATFADRSWNAARPEVRVIGRRGAEPVAHLGVLRRFLRVPDDGRHLLVGDVGLVAVDPDVRRRGLGLRLLAETATLLDGLGLPFGFLTCRAEVVPFYRAGGWHRVEDQVTRMIDDDGAVEVYRGGALVLPVRADLASWPAALVDRGGQEV